MGTPFTPQAIDGPPATPPVYGLLVAADLVNDGADWEAGAKWRPEQIGGGGVVPLDGCGDTGDGLGTATNPKNTTAEPFVVWAEDHCSLMSGTRANEEYEARARRQLAATESFSVAREFQIGTLRDLDSLANIALKDATVIHPGAIDPLTAVAELEGALGETFKGRRGMIHVSPTVMTILHATYVLERAGQKWITAQGTIVCSDAGYTHEADGFLYAYASGPVAVRLGAVDVPAPFGTLGTIDRTVNDVKLYAQRLALVQVDSVIADTVGSGSADAIFKVQLDTKPWALHS